MTFVERFRREWLSNIPTELLSGTLVALALIPEAIGFSIVAGVDPKIGLYASFSIAVVTAIVGGRPAMISAATASTAVLMITLVRDHGLQYLFAATVLMGLIQIVAGALRLGLLMKFVSRSVMTGFVNALAILIFMAQLPQLINVGWPTYPMVAAGLGIIYLFPYVTKRVPSALVAIIVLTAFTLLSGIKLRTVGDMGELPSSLPFFALPQVPFNFETLRIILPYSLTMAAVGLLESLLTASIVDDMTDTSSNKNRECVGQGVANFVTGFLGAMGGCAMIGQSVINVTAGARTRLSTLFAGCLLLFLIVVLGDWVKQIPMAALVAVMIMVSISTFSWSSVTNLRSHPLSSSVVMLTVVVLVVVTGDLSMGVLGGVVMSGVFFAAKVARLLDVGSERSADGGGITYRVRGQVFFASTQSLIDAFDYQDVPARVCIDVSAAHFWDISAIGALDDIVLKLRRHGADVEVMGLNQASETMVEKFGTHHRAQTP
ncbi:SulP family inorganic anion transporter [Tardiphaga sp. vice352]|uniref:SulP family inorganic anion transporter n=1 Tax=unclassified Tardiphaga TaxID=2631404 RepID=UPI0011654224|nr:MULTISPECIES: SulP family inorganic anion transporter [unclassified Tardiphaga]MBC7584935.1 SulP family inorganic anion transporter [Tardiphaga sp.]QDM15298.1 SulP family inorganic anion transporter [Tardiphaga sp. vice278]QDM25468.1 SulP family inorganic anion transporter [Tardiphaga sp. vice304]QDM30677.1 SulP family inorganic anion transporter [Tardiphaga sp. vice352]